VAPGYELLYWLSAAVEQAISKTSGCKITTNLFAYDSVGQQFGLD
jgi:hypothetical protein